MLSNPLAYPAIVDPLSDEDGGGFVVRVPDLPGCMSYGESPEEAVINVQDAIAARIEMAAELGHSAPPPTRAVARAG